MRQALKFHLIGVGGVGMSALATLLFRQGHTVTGADRTLTSANVEFLRSLGIEVFPDDGSAVDSSVDRVVVSTAIEDTNPGLVRARELSIPVVHRAAALSEALAERKLVAVVGTCGKSTVTAMLGHILAECGLDPLCVNGANVPGWEGAVRFGGGEYAVAEVDESDKSLVAFKPYAAVVTNASADHYPKEEMDEVFDAFVKDAQGPVVDARGETYRPQDYNLQNASLAVRMAVRLGCGEDAAKRAMESFGGVERRLQLIGNRPGASGAFIYDDYAHNPEKIRSMWLTLAERHPQGICVIWRPHGYGPLRKLLNPLAEMFNETIRPQDKLLLLPVYDAGGTACRDLNSSALAAKIDGNKVEPVDGLQAAYRWCTIHYAQFTAFVTCGARDPALPSLAKDLHEL